MLDINRPLHAYDADKIEKGIIVRNSNSGEKLIVASQNSLNVQANINDSLDCVLSYVEIS